MENENFWDSSDYQGRTREQVEADNTIAAIAMTASGLLFIAGIVSKLIHFLTN